MAVKVIRKISDQVIAENKTKVEQPEAFEGNFAMGAISTGSLLLDLAISGSAYKGGGLPGGILVEVFGPNGVGKTVLLTEIAGAVQRQGGSIIFQDPEARLNKKFAQIFDLRLKEEEHTMPDTVTEVFQTVRKWKPENPDVINGIFTDSLAALSTDMEMEKDEGDKMGMRRAKEFSEQLRKTCRILQKNNWLMVASNQVRVKADAVAYGESTTTPGGVSVGFYASVRLKAKLIKKIKVEKKYKGKEVTRIVGTQIEVEVYKNSCDKPYRTAPVYIMFDYGIDDIRANLQFIKDYSGKKVYTLRGESLGVSMDEAIAKIEEGKLEKALRNEVIRLWTDIESQFKSERVKKRRN